MKLLRVGPPGNEKPALLDKDGILRDASAWVRDWSGANLHPRVLSKWAGEDATRLPRLDGAARLGPCVAAVGKVVCIGLNYADHAREAKTRAPTEPIVFLKSPTAICGPNDPIIIPRGSSKTDWEVELGLVIGRRAKRVTRAHALDHIAGYCIINDVSERAFQLEHGGQWTKGKSCDTFAPIGPWLVTRDEIEDAQNLAMWSEVDGKRYQHSNTKQMIFKIDELVSYLSRFMTLMPGDLIATGTPAGVGMGQKPEPIYLKAGQTLTLGINQLGRQQQVLGAE